MPCHLRWYWPVWIYCRLFFLSTHIGIDYLVDDGFEVAQMLVAILLGIEDVPSQEMEDVVDQEEAECEDTEMKPLDGETKPTDQEDVKKSPTQPTEPNATDVTATTTTTEIADNKSSNDPEAMELAENDDIQDLAQKHCKRSYEDQFIKLGIELSYKVQTRYHLDAIVYYSTVAEPYDASNLATHLHALYSMPMADNIPWKLLVSIISYTFSWILSSKNMMPDQFLPFMIPLTVMTIK
ncbi:protein virilizer-like [Musca autumnalis]|uniref:protein virilizer-like n=1 Tax=Musca autumnalis TaxID=221902 RepID=UPI003CEFE783